MNQGEVRERAEDIALKPAERPPVEQHLNTNCQESLEKDRRIVRPVDDHVVCQK